MKRSTTFLLFILVALFAGWLATGCQSLKEEPAHFEESESANVSQKYIPVAEGWTIPCQGSVCSIGTFGDATVSHAGYDNLILFDGGTPVLPRGCTCLKSWVWVKFKHPKSAFSSMALLDANGNTVHELVGFGGTQLETNAFLADFGVASLSGISDPDDYHIVFPPNIANSANQLLVKMNPAYSGGVTATELVKGVTGICVIEDIPNPHFIPIFPLVPMSVRD